MMIIKLGGSFITFKKEDGAPPYKENERNLTYRIRENRIRDLALSIKDVDEPVIFVHGGGTHGHRTVTRWRSGLVKGKDPMMAWEVRWRMDQLTNDMIRVMGMENVPAISLPTSNVVTSDKGKIASFNAQPLEMILDRDCYPVLRGDLAPDVNGGWSVVSGDTLIMKLCKHYSERQPGISRVIMLMDTDGFKDPVTGRRIGEIGKEMFKAKKADWEKALNKTEGDVSGGIWGKVKDCIEISSLGIEVFLLGGNVKEDMEAVLSGKRAGTRFPPAAR